MSKHIKIQLIIPNPDQPRTIFDQEELDFLAQSIKENGLIQPIVVEQAAGQYILVDGERRWRACQMIGMKTIPAEVRPATNHGGLERLTQALVANIQRSNMGPLDEAKAYQKLIDQYGDVQLVADKVGVKAPVIYMRLGLLDFPEEVQRLYNLRRLPLESQSIAMLKSLPKAQCTRIALKAATRGVSIKTLKRLIEIEKGDSAYQPRKRTEKQLVIDTPPDGHFDALLMVGGKQLPQSVRTAATRTCKACSLYPEASPAMCRECPLPEFLRKLETT